MGKIQKSPSIQAIDGEIQLTEAHRSDLLSLGIRTILVDRILLSMHQQQQIIERLIPDTWTTC